MRVLFTTFAAKSHMFAYVPLAWALRAAGHEVVVASQPDLVEDITRCGLTAVPIGRPLNLEAELREMDELREEAETDYGQEVEWARWVEVLDIAERRPEKLTPEYAQAVLTAHTSLIFQYFSLQNTVDDLVEFACGWGPDLVVWDAMTFAGGVAGVVSGAAHARLLFGLDLVGGLRGVLLGGGGVVDDPLEEWLGWTLGRFGCGFSEEVVVGQWTVDPVPGSLRLPVGGLSVPVRYVPFNGASVVPGWLGAGAGAGAGVGGGGRRRVCVSLGVSHREVLGGDRVRVGELLEGLGGLDVEVVATLDASQLGGVSVPENVRLVDFVPLDV
ncbi:glycosyl transferase family 28, partial [Streptomyces glomeratus]|uniref:glycosyl transferase family 28 n=1 Tax=Streptomyces glomeratus TaxID=284452 RepID=UPI0031DF5969